MPILLIGSVAEDSIDETNMYYSLAAAFNVPSFIIQTDTCHVSRSGGGW